MNKKSVFISIMVILFMVFSLGVGYFLGNKETVSEVKVKKDNEKKLTDEEIDELGKQLFWKTSNNYMEKYFYYNADKLTVDDISLEDKLWIAFDNINLADIYYNTDENCMGSTDENCYYYKVSKEIFIKIYYELFNLHLDNIDQFSYKDGICKLKDNYIYYSKLEIGSTTGEARFIDYDKTEYKDGNIYVYSNFIVLEPNENLYYIYNDYNLTQKIDEIKDSQIILNYYLEGRNKVDFIKNSGIMKKYADKVGKYKLTFKQSDLGNWYWVQTEVIK